MLLYFFWFLSFVSNKTTLRIKIWTSKEGGENENTEVWRISQITIWEGRNEIKQSIVFKLIGYQVLYSSPHENYNCLLSLLTQLKRGRCLALWKKNSNEEWTEQKHIRIGEKKERSEPARCPNDQTHAVRSLRHWMTGYHRYLFQDQFFACSATGGRHRFVLYSIDLEISHQQKTFSRIPQNATCYLLLILLK